MKTLICGLPGSGKTEYAKKIIKNSNALCYDLDHIAAAFRLSNPHAEYNLEARKMADDFLNGFINKSNQYTDHSIIIRTSPSVEECEAIDPDKIIIMRTKYDISWRNDFEEYDFLCKSLKIKMIEKWAIKENIPLDVIT